MKCLENQNPEIFISMKLSNPLLAMNPNGRMEDLQHEQIQISKILVHSSVSSEIRFILSKEGKL